MYTQEFTQVMLQEKMRDAARMQLQHEAREAIREQRQAADAVGRVVRGRRIAFPSIVTRALRLAPAS